MSSCSLTTGCRVLIFICILVADIRCSVISTGDDQTATSQVPTRYTKSICPPDKIITGGRGGRLGNVIWDYTTVLALSMYIRGNYTPYSNHYNSNRMDTVFDNVDLPLTDDIPTHCNCCVGHNFNVPNVRQNEFYDLNFTRNNFTSQNNVLALFPYAILIEHVMLKMDVIKKRLPYKQQFIDHANKVFSLVKSIYLKKNSQIKEEEITFVGVHVRRTDFLNAITEILKKKTVGAKYFLRAFQYFRQRKDLGRPVFVVVSDDPEWVRKNLYSNENQSDVFLVSRGDIESPGNDIVMLSLCNHTIIDYGSYGFWPAVYAGGEVITTKISHSNVVKSLEKYPKWHFVDVDDEGDFRLVSGCQDEHRDSIDPDKKVYPPIELIVE